MGTWKTLIEAIDINPDVFPSNHLFTHVINDGTTIHDLYFRGDCAERHEALALIHELGMTETEYRRLWLTGEIWDSAEEDYPGHALAWFDLEMEREADIIDLEAHRDYMDRYVA